MPKQQVQYAILATITAIVVPEESLTNGNNHISSHPRLRMLILNLEGKERKKVKVNIRYHFEQDERVPAKAHVALVTSNRGPIDHEQIRTAFGSDGKVFVKTYQNVSTDPNVLNDLFLLADKDSQATRDAIQKVA